MLLIPFDLRLPSFRLLRLCLLVVCMLDAFVAAKNLVKKSPDELVPHYTLRLHVWKPAGHNTPAETILCLVFEGLATEIFVPHGSRDPNTDGQQFDLGKVLFVTHEHRQDIVAILSKTAAGNTAGGKDQRTPWEVMDNMMAILVKEHIFLFPDTSMASWEQILYTETSTELEISEYFLRGPHSTGSGALQLSVDRKVIMSTVPKSGQMDVTHQTLLSQRLHFRNRDALERALLQVSSGTKSTSKGTWLWIDKAMKILFNSKSGYVYIYVKAMTTETYGYWEQAMGFGSSAERAGVPTENKALGFAGSAKPVVTSKKGTQKGNPKYGVQKNRNTKKNVLKSNAQAWAL
ncbi:hypothetical protein EV361DRAFT_931615 [Lentinula raphanica]|uniref:Uncharacterized protein n=1 Tax=Lentinula raphanica TaxID=153919 RepID=A0AA38PJB7_9AGAR|nr:hypothetical protein F5880DRAFT_1532402 [Lentinula raphanica]KAJ3844013.1 hypothetical protein F5878DRAFT_603145 [Lentinula raphanica]KAJ3967229.1 hypothetical protein EV361DRAFT_931615 [Lentinula raphanica]